MTPEQNDAVRTFTALFANTYHDDRRSARIMIIGLFAACHSIQSPEDRVKSFQAICTLVEDINCTLFEDGQDFLQYLGDKTVERINEMKRLQDEDDSSNQ